ncbi:MAG: TonB-dependent receptor, partial [Bacteroidota bacterium]
LGFIATLSYRSNYDHFVDGIERRFKNTDSTATTLNNELNLRSNESSRNVLLGGLVKLSFKPRTNHKFGLNYMLNRSGESRANDLFGSIPEQNIDNYETRVLAYTERSLDVVQLQGEHAFGSKNAEGAIEKPVLKANWIASYSESRQDEPDLRFFSNEFNIFEREPQPDTIYTLDLSVYAEPSRFFRELAEDNLDIKLNFEVPLNLSERPGSFKFGGAYTQKERDFIERRFTLDTDLRRAPYEGDPAAWFTDENIGIAEIDTLSNGAIIPRFNGIYQERTVQSNSYVGEQEIVAAYGMFELPLTEKLKFIGGARLEITDASVVSGNPNDPEGILDLQDVLPSANFIYEVLDNMNLRAGYSRTLARPNFREFSSLRTFPFERGNETVGNPNLERTLIDNFDVRWEWYPQPREIISVSVFYKDFENPIEKVIIPAQQNLAFRFGNVPTGRALGAEFEVRKSLSFLGDFFSNFEIGGNLSILDSEVDINEEELELIRTVDPTRPSTRPIFGQSPYVVNGELLYNDPVKGSQVSISYNIFGERIVLVGGQSAPDVYEQPRGLLNVSIAQRFGPFQVRLSGRNLLNPDFEKIQTHEFLNRDANGNRTGGTSEREYVFQRFTRGSTYSLSVAYNFN